MASTLCSRLHLAAALAVGALGRGRIVFMYPSSCGEGAGVARFGLPSTPARWRGVERASETQDTSSLPAVLRWNLSWRRPTLLQRRAAVANSAFLCPTEPKLHVANQVVLAWSFSEKARLACCKLGSARGESSLEIPNALSVGHNEDAERLPSELFTPVPTAAWLHPHRQDQCRNAEIPRI